MNGMKTAFLMTLMMVLLLLIGEAFGGAQGMVLAFLFSLVMNIGMYWFSDKVVLMMYRAQEVTESDQPRLVRIVHRLAAQAQVPAPRVYLITSEAANAFATGRSPDHAAIAVTSGILQSLSDDELEGVLSHEFAHIKHRDILTGTIVATMVGTITLIARMAGWAMIFSGGRSDDRDSGGGLGDILMLILAPLAAVLIQLAISRSREFAADAGGSQICGKPLSLANALKKLDRESKQIPMTNAQPATSHLFIVNPLRSGGIAKLFATHPPMEERIARLEQIAMRGTT
ncbi:MAG TPA: zinc metalloprotease HtpX [Bacteroidota bacterium]|nr:zinc metalloprotease HtpX [Bacteroidota bacterium]